MPSETPTPMRATRRFREAWGNAEADSPFLWALWPEMQSRGYAFDPTAEAAANEEQTFSVSMPLFGGYLIELSLEPLPASSARETFGFQPYCSVRSRTQADLFNRLRLSEVWRTAGPDAAGRVSPYTGAAAVLTLHLGVLRYALLGDDSGRHAYQVIPCAKFDDALAEFLAAFDGTIGKLAPHFGSWQSLVQACTTGHVDGIGTIKRQIRWPEHEAAMVLYGDHGCRDKAHVQRQRMTDALLGEFVDGPSDDANERAIREIDRRYSAWIDESTR